MEIGIHDYFMDLIFASKNSKTYQIKYLNDITGNYCFTWKYKNKI